MAYAQSHRIEYKDYKDLDCRIEIWDDGYDDDIMDCDVADDPLTIEIATFDPNIFIPVVGTGAVINLISATNGQLSNLYTINPKKRMVKIYKGASEVPWWLGYINVEQYSEGYSRIENYPVSINCNDGFNILSRYKYLDESGNKYNTLESKWTILTRIITKMGLPFNMLYFACRLSSDGVSVATDETLFDRLKADQCNYYDEQEEPMTFREVLEGILSAYGLQIRWLRGALIIYEPQMLADESISAKVFNTNFEYGGTASLVLNFDITDGPVNWDNEDQVLGSASGASKQAITFSPYSYDHAVPVVDLQDETKWVGTPDWELSQKDGDPETAVYYPQHPIGIAGFTFPLYWTGLSGRKVVSSDVPEMYIQCPYGTLEGNVCIETEPSGIWLSGVQGSSILFKAKVFVRTKTWEYNNEEMGRVVKQLIVKVAIEIGGKRPYSETPRDPIEWAESTTDFYYITVHKSGENIANQWVDVEFQFPWSFPAGELIFKIFDDFRAYDDMFKGIADDPLPADWLGLRTINNIRFKDIEFLVIDVKNPAAGGRIGTIFEAAALNDKEFTGKLNEEFLQEGTPITLIHGDGINVADRGAVRKSDNSYTTGWQKDGDTESHLLPEILLRSIISQYQDSLTELTGTIEADALIDETGPTFLLTLQDTDYLGAKKMIFAGGTYNDFKRTLNGRFLEVKQEDLTINIV